MKQNRLFLKKNAIWCIFTLFVVAVFVKLLLFHFSCFHQFEPTDGDDFRFWLSKLLAAIFLGSFVFLFKRHSLTIVVLIAMDLWLCANVVYFRANDLFINVSAIKMIDNLHGFESAILPYMNTHIVWIILTTVLYSVVYMVFLVHRTPRLWKISFVIWCAFVLLIPFMLYPTWKNDTYRTSHDVRVLLNESRMRKLYNDYKTLFLPFYRVRGYAKPGLIAPPKDWEKKYVQDNTILQFIPAIIINYLVSQSYLDTVNISPEEENTIMGFINYNKSSHSIKPMNMIVLFVESFESWAINMEDKNHTPVMPNMATFCKRKDVACFTRIKSEVLHGVSGDGQMTFNTGLLPIDNGAACIIYGDNCFPGFAYLYDSAWVINPRSGTWNQNVVAKNYGYKHVIESEDNMVQDDWVMQQLLSSVNSISEQSFCTFAITISSHSPFKTIINNKFQFPSSIPPMAQDYLTCLNFTDSCFGEFIREFEKSDMFNSTVIVITGDHTVFRQNLLPEIAPHIKTDNNLIFNGQSYVPFIVCSPFISTNIQNDNMYYQYDIFTTLLHIIGAENYYWKGFGVNMLDSTSCAERPIDENSAYNLSNKIIRSNWFTKLQ